MEQTENSLQIMEQRIAIIMRIGVGISMTIMIIGLALFFMTPATAVPTNLVDIYQAMLSLNGTAWMMMGLFCLILTPVLRVVSSIIYFLHAKDTTYVLITGLVLAILVVGMIYGAIG
ncbi:DUF1634 domain-containing protein [Weissella tructae]|uniref:Integral membrane protein n=2 Tax=Weissella TaxID=46255 RepID=A0A075TUI4_9LACO|nr:MULTISPECIES: DUF1634 domain-containing protein [Weissella]AIG65229.1 hypothetical protein WS08_0290 [Weissella tructae]AIM62542.1 hypothetical protein WS74_0290 [Weissella ceti]AIM63878.1 hypothetical protein WS105_0288 [Weissella ceti]ELA07629.1 hypothetical protein WCNC_01460 [Weissella ceti NC36]QVV91607.1 DUF1634 domain-containing protein [Weissella tructae]